MPAEDSAAAPAAGRKTPALAVWVAHRTTLEAAIERLGGDAAKAELRNSMHARLAVVASNDWQGLHLLEHLLVDVMEEEDVRNHALHAALVARRAGLDVNAGQIADLDKLTQQQLRSRAHAILADLFEQHAQRDLKHRSRRRAAARLALHGAAFGTVMLALIVGLAVRGPAVAAIITDFHLMLVVYFGGLGAYVSQLIGYYGAIPSIDYRTIENRYSNWSLNLRYLMGAFAALLICLLVAGQLLAGDMFPALAKLKEGVWGSGPGHALPSVDFAKLLVWSFLAGFSERLLTEQLTRIEGAKPAA